MLIQFLAIFLLRIKKKKQIENRQFLFDIFKFIRNRAFEKSIKTNIIHFEILCRFWPNSILNNLGRNYVDLKLKKKKKKKQKTYNILKTESMSMKGIAMKE